MCRRIFSRPANRYVRSPGNQARQGGSDRKSARRAARTSATKREGRATAESSGRLLVQPRDKKSRGHPLESCGRQCDVPRHAPFFHSGPAAKMVRARSKRTKPLPKCGGCELIETDAKFA